MDPSTATTRRASGASCPGSDGSGADRIGPAVGPPPCGLDLSAQGEEEVLPGRGAGELDPDRQAVVAVEERQRDGRLAGDVEDCRERGEAAGAGGGLPWVGAARRR